MSRQISPQRKSLHKLGMAVAAFGLLMFLSVFVSGLLNIGDFTNFEGRARSMGLRAVGGIVMVMAGMAMITLAAGGAAGSGFNLDPEQARKDLEPWARMRGGLQKDALDEMGVDVPKIVDALTGRTTAGGESVESRLRGLHNLYKDGLLSEEEYQREKRELLDG